MFNPKRLSIARKRRRLTGKRLAELVGVTSVTISRLETANNEPDVDTLVSLVNVLGFPKEFFFGDDIDELTPDAASFRSLTAMTAKEREAALCAGSLAYLLADWVDDRFNLPKTDLIDLSRERDPEGAAQALRQYWGLGEQPISNMLQLMEAKGIRVFSLCENTKSVDAFSCWRDEMPYVFLNTFKSAERSRFDAAHELGHLILHKHGGPQQGGKSAEVEANHFAAAFLMPKDDVFSRIPYVSSVAQLIIAKKRWRVSVAALAYRLQKLAILSPWQYRSFSIQISSLGYRTEEPESIPKEESIVWKKVFSELWNDRITKNHVADELNLPFDEIENLVFGLVGSAVYPKDRGRKKPDLRVV